MKKELCIHLWSLPKMSPARAKKGRSQEYRNLILILKLRYSKTFEFPIKTWGRNLKILVRSANQRLDHLLMINQLLPSLQVSTWDPPVSACDQEKYICAVIFSSKRHFFGEKRRFFKRRMHGFAVETFLLAPFLRGAAEINETNWVETGSEQHSTQREMAETFWGVNDYLFVMQVG